VPWIFAPVKIGGREYVDGGVWSPTNLDTAPARRGSEVLCLNPTASLPPRHAPVRALRAFSRSTAAAETLALRARGASVRTIAPDARAAEAMGVNLMNRARMPQVLAAGYAQGKALAA
jgi:NTE family protein